MVERRNLVAVVGGSGSGKSSIVRAGLVPRLRARNRQMENRKTVWDIVMMVPGENPLHSLADAILPLVEPELKGVDLVERRSTLAKMLHSGNTPLWDLVAESLKRQKGTDRLLLVVDQWEDLYTQCEDVTARGRFITELLDATGRKQSPLSVVLAVRTDFQGEIQQHRQLLDRLHEGKLHLGPMTRDELRVAIEEPAKSVGLAFQVGLVDRLLDHAGEEPGRLALLEFALEELWKRRDHNELTHAAYKDLGELSGAIATRAEEVYEALTPDEQAAAPALFRRLVRAGADMKHDTRRRADFSSLAAAAQRVAHKLADRRLLVISRTDSRSGDAPSAETVEVAHEELLRHWSRLREWINEDRSFLQWCARLQPLVDEYHRDPESALLRRGALREARQYFPAREAEMEDAARSFVEASFRAERRQRTSNWLAFAATVVVVFSVTFGAWWSIRRGKDRDAVDGAVMNLPVASSANVGDLLENLRRRPDYAVKQLRAAYDVEQETTKKLRLAVGLMVVGAVKDSTDEFTRFVLDNIDKVLKEDYPLIVDVLSRLTDVENVRQELHTRSDPNGAVEETDIVVRTQYALAAMSLGRMEAAERLQIADGDPTPRTVFIRDFVHWPIRTRELAVSLSRAQDADVRSGLCLALGGVHHSRWTREEFRALKEQLLRLYLDDPDAGVHSAAGWALTEWQVMLPSFSRTSAPPREPLAGNRSWFVNSLGMTMIRIPKDEKRKYRLGSVETTENPVRNVESSRIWLSACEVTVEQFQSIHATSKSHSTNAEPSGASDRGRPITNVTWYDAVNYCNLLSERERFPTPFYYEISDIERDPDGRIHRAKVKSGVGLGYRLPTEAEWEIACRAETTTDFSFGNQERELGDYGWFSNNSKGTAEPVASKRSNPWGLHDMHGNVWEWCEHEFVQQGVPDSVARPDDLAKATDQHKGAMRGGSWFDGQWNCRSAVCNRFWAIVHYDNRGFRVCLDCNPNDGT